MPGLRTALSRTSALVGTGAVFLLLALSLPVSQTSWTQILTVAGAVSMRAPEGCSTGFWKQPHHFDAWPAPYQPDTSFEASFERDVPNDPTLLEALELRGGSLNALMRHSAAALLNAASPDIHYAYSVDEVVTGFQGAFDSGDYEATKDAFEAANEAGCPLNGTGAVEQLSPAPSPSPMNNETATSTPTPSPSASEDATTPTPIDEGEEQATPNPTEPPAGGVTPQPGESTSSPTASASPSGTPTARTDPASSTTPTDVPETDNTPTPTPSPAPAAPKQGCPAAFWAQEANHIHWPDPYATDDIFQALFDREMPGEDRLLELLESEGSKHDEFTRETVAALLNAASSEVEYPLTEDHILSDYLEVLDGAGSVPVDRAVELLESYNRSDCPWSWPDSTATDTPHPTATPTSTPPPTATSGPESPG